ncbi:hypothetical protein MHU86_14654 [Fragilaria crotonensis]|nr:hypothetical protein MHU86_14654 [Fragilaria crotonensis]
MDTLEEIQLLSDDEIENLCKVIRRPGGTIPGLKPGDAPVNVPGTPISLRAENHLKLLALYLRHQKQRISRVVNVANVTLKTIRTLRKLRDFEMTYKAPNNPPTINPKGWPKTMERIHEYLRSYLREQKIPLAYVVRKDDAIPTIEPEGGYATVQDEMIACASHYTLGPNGTILPDPTYITIREKDFIKQTSKSKTTPTMGISEVKTCAAGSKRKSKAVEDSYYTKAEYDAKRELVTKRLKRGHKPGAKES